MIISHIAAMAKNRVIGKDGDLPWRLPEDLKYFKDKTLQKMIVMGRKTFESLPKPLPNRLNIVITRQADYKAPDGVHVFSSIPDAIAFCETQSESWGEDIFIIGGGEIYRQTLELASTLYLTEIDSPFEGDAQYPSFGNDFTLAQKDQRFEPMNYSFNIYSRK